MKATLKATTLVVLAVVLGLATVQGSLALWNKSVAVAPGAVTGADFRVLVTGAGDVARPISTNGKPTSVELAGIDGLKPGGSKTIPVRVENAADAGSGTFRIRAALANPVITGTLRQQLSATIESSSGGSCAQRSPESSREIAQNASFTFCLTVQMKAGAPASFSGSTAEVAIDVTATQL